MSVVSIATLKSYFETGDFPTQAQFVDLIDTLDNASTSVYKRYVAILSQAGVAAPTAVVLENTLGGTLVWSYSGVGSYLATLSGAFSQTKTFLPKPQVENFDRAVISGWNDANSIYLSQITPDWAGGFTATDVFTNVMIEIRVYP